MSKYEARRLTSQDTSEWDSLVEASPHGTIFHTSDWYSICGDTTGRTPRLYGCYNKNGELQGGCLLYSYIDTPLFKVASSRLELVPYGGFVLKELATTKRRKQEKTYHRVVDALRTTIEQENYDYLELVNAPGFTDIRPLLWNGWASQLFYTYHLDLQDDIHGNYSQSVRRTVRKAEEDDMTVRQHDDPDLFYRLFSLTYERQGVTPPVEPDFFHRILAMLHDTDRGEMWCVETDTGTPAAAEIIVWDNKRAYRWGAASHPDLIRTGAPTLLSTRILEEWKDRGFTEFNLMGGNMHHLARFIAKLNPILVPYYGADKKNLRGKTARYLYNRFKDNK